MSLTKFIAIPDVRERFKAEFSKPAFTLEKEIVAPPLTTNYGMVGTAFDYLLRFYVQRLNATAIGFRWIAEQAVERELDSFIRRRRCGDGDNVFIMQYYPYDKYFYDRFAKEAKIVAEAKGAYYDYLKTGKINTDILRSVCFLAQLDLIFRTGKIDKNMGKVTTKDMNDLRKLISIVQRKHFKSKTLCILNPTFGDGSILVGGGDCDILIDDTLIDIKTTKELELKRSYIDQLIGYFILSKIGGTDKARSNHKINNLGIYFSRFGELYTFKVKDVIIDSKKQDKFISWFKKRARKQYDGSMEDFLKAKLAAKLSTEDILEGELAATMEDIANGDRF